MVQDLIFVHWVHSVEKASPYKFRQRFHVLRDANLLIHVGNAAWRLP